MPQPLPDDAIARALAALPGWTREGEEIVRTFDRGNFNGSIAFVNAIATAANAAAFRSVIASILRPFFAELKTARAFPGR